MVKAPLPITFAEVIIGSNITYNPVIKTSISGEKKRYFSRIGNITTIPPAGTATIANLNNKKHDTSIHYCNEYNVKQCKYAFNFGGK